MGLVHPVSLPSYPRCILESIRNLTVLLDKSHITHSSQVAQSLIQVIPMIKNLSSLYLALPFNKVVSLLDVVSRSKITTLILDDSDFPQSNSECIMASSVCNLTNPISSNLKNLVLDLRLSQSDLKALCNIVFGQTSLKQLTLCIDFFYEESLNLLQTNSCLTHVQFKGVIQHAFRSFSNILRKNRTIQVLRWYVSPHTLIDSEQMKAFQESLSVNTTLKEFIVLIGKRNPPRLDFSLLPRNPRVSLKYAL